MTDLFDSPTPTEKAAFRARLAEATGRALDAAGQPFIPAAERWMKEAARRESLRTPENKEAVREAHREQRDAMRDVRRDQKAFEMARDEVQWWNVWNGERRAARLVVRDTKAIAAEKRALRREAEKDYPQPLTTFAAKVHALHLVPTFLWSSLSDSFLSGAAVAGSATAIALNVAAVALGGRHVATAVAPTDTSALQPTAAEADLLQRLDPAEWMRFAEPRGLSDAISSGGKLTPSGITAKFTLNGTMDLDKLRKATPHLRAALRLAAGVRLELREGATGGHAVLTLRTRSKADNLNMTGWQPGDPWAVDTVTGETIPVPLGKRILFAGTSGAGKSWSARPLMAEASERPDHRLVIFDRKYVEARNWEHRARTASELDDMYALCEELVAEGEARLKLIPRGEDVVSISPERPRITVFVDEGGELLSDCKGKVDVGDGEKIDYADIVDTLRTVARKYRAAEIIIVWCTQKPTLTGDGHGLDSQIAGQVTIKLALALATATDTSTVFGNDAVEKGWKAHELPMPGYALLRDQELGPNQSTNMIKMRAMSPKHVIALPSKPIWSRGGGGQATKADLRKRAAYEAEPAANPWEADMGAAPADPVKAAPAAPVKAAPKPVKVKPADRDDMIMEVLAEDPCLPLSEVARRVGAHKQTVKRRLEQMEADGLVEKDADGCWTPAG
jgi:hypothetical protein